MAGQIATWKQITVAAVMDAAAGLALAGLPGAQARISSANSLGLRSGDGGIEVALTEPSYQLIAAAAEEFGRRMEELPGLSVVRAQYQATQPQRSITIDRRCAADLGVPMSALSAILRALIDEEEITDLTIGDKAVPVMLQSSAGTIRDPADLLNLYVRSEAGHLVPPSKLVDFSEEGVAAELDRHGQRRAIEIDAAVWPDLSLSGAVEQIRDLGRETLPPGIGLLMLVERRRSMRPRRR